MGTTQTAQRARRVAAREGTLLALLDFLHRNPDRKALAPLRRLVIARLIALEREQTA